MPCSLDCCAAAGLQVLPSVMQGGGEEGMPFDWAAAAAGWPAEQQAGAVGSPPSQAAVGSGAEPAAAAAAAAQGSGACRTAQPFNMAGGLQIAWCMFHAAGQIAAPLRQLGWHALLPAATALELMPSQGSVWCAARRRGGCSRGRAAVQWSRQR